KELHKWIDEPSKYKGINHRSERHYFNLKDKNYIKKKWGDKAVVEWLFHIAVDNLETAFKSANKAYRGKNAYNFFKFGLIPNSKFIYLDFERLDEDKLKDKFKESYKNY
ncbi:hypothetical protein KY312_03110, partial [Candidatus Woesearchaeota archaeon]|nr:hypothetical protein [Candidatus Woesearchaeota archaeon]